MYVAGRSDSIATSGILSDEQSRDANSLEIRDVGFRGRMVACFGYHRRRLATDCAVTVHGSNEVGPKLF